MNGSAVFDLAVAFGCFVTAALLTRAVRNFALASGLIDVPGVRSSHVMPTPRGGGVAIAVAAVVALLVSWIAGRVGAQLAVAVIGGGAIAAGVGYLDDRHNLSAGLRLVVHLLAAAGVVAWLGGWQELQIGERLIDPGWW